MALVNDGRNFIAAILIANPTNLFDVTKATIGVGNSATVYSATQSNLVAVGTANTEYNVVDIAPTVATNVLTFVATFGTAEANFAWQEWGVFNTTGSPTTNGTTLIMLNRKAESLGTKTTAQSWEITATLTVNIGT